MSQVRLALALIALALLVAGDAMGAASVPGLRAAIENFVRARAPESARIQVPDLDGFADEPLPPGEPDIALRVHPDTPMRGLVPVTAVVSVGGREQKRGVVTVQVDELRRVVVATRRLARGARVRESDLAIKTVPVERVPGDALLDPAELVGRQTRRTVASGAVWRSSMVAYPPVVRRGEMVRLRIARGSLRIEARGRAREDGHAGGLMRVLNVDSRREVTGRVGDDGVVHVEF